MKKLITIGLIIVGCLLSGCTDGQRRDWAALGNPHKIEMFSGGQKIREWVSTGYVESSSGSDGYFFTDKVSKALVKVSGDVVITMLDD